MVPRLPNFAVMTTGFIVEGCNPIIVRVGLAVGFSVTLSAESTLTSGTSKVYVPPT